MTRFEIHSHTWYSNLRLIDSINNPIKLVDRAIELGLCGIAITDHEALCGHIKLNEYQKKLLTTHKDFKIGLGNEIYLVNERKPNQSYFHFILIAKNAAGHKALRELSSYSWMNSYMDRGMERVPTTYAELAAIVKKYPNSLIASSACLAGQLSSDVLNLIRAEKAHNEEDRQKYHQDIVNFIFFCKDLFGDDFYIECAPGRSPEQRMVNTRLASISECFNIPMVIGTDAHFLKKEDRYVHKAYLNSQNGEREVDSFYEYAYLQSNEEIKENLDFTEAQVEKMFENSVEIYNKIEVYSLLHKQQIPSVELDDYPATPHEELKDYPILQSMFVSKDKVERNWINQCWDKLNKKIGLWSEHLDYVARLEEEARTKRVIGQKLETNMFKYPLTLQHYIDMIWDCGSTVGAGRGSSCSGLNHYLLGVTQLDPIKHELPWYRYLNDERTEIGDIDIDICPSKKNEILQRIKDERGTKFIPSIDEVSRKNLGCTMVATFGTESSKSVVLSACRGYRSEECPDGIDVDVAQYISSLIPSTRGFVWSLHDVFFGDEEKDRKPITTFIKEVEKYNGLKEVMLGIEGTIKQRGSHASGVIFFDEDPYEHCCFMKTPSGDVITQYDLHDAEKAG